MDELERTIRFIIGIQDQSVNITFEQSKDKTIPQNLYLVKNNSERTYSKDNDDNLLDSLRGMVVDIDKHVIVSKPIVGYVEKNSIVCDKLTITKDYNLSINDTLYNNFTLYKAYDGMLIRVLWYENQLILISNSNIGLVGSKRRGVNIKQLALDILPPADQLFDTSYPCSSTIYHFMLIDRAFATVSRQDPTSRYVYITSSIWSSDYPKGIFTQSEDPPLTIIEANNFLSKGYFDTTNDNSLGESILVKVNEGEIDIYGNIINKEVIKVNSTQFARNLEILDWGTTNLPTRVFQLLSHSRRRLSDFPFTLYNEDGAIMSKDDIDKLRQRDSECHSIDSHKFPSYNIKQKSIMYNVLNAASPCLVNPSHYQMLETHNKNIIVVTNTILTFIKHKQLYKSFLSQDANIELFNTQLGKLLDVVFTIKTTKATFYSILGHISDMSFNMQYKFVSSIMRMRKVYNITFT